MEKGWVADLSCFLEPWFQHGSFEDEVSTQPMRVFFH